MFIVENILFYHVAGAEELAAVEESVAATVVAVEESMAVVAAAVVTAVAVADGCDCYLL